MMPSWPHLHLMLNHLPALGTLFGALLLAASVVFGGDGVRKAALYTFAITAVLSLGTFLAGEQSESVVRDLACVASDLIGEHEEFAESALTGSAILGFFSATVLLRSWGRGVSIFESLVLLVVAIAVSGVMAWTAELGGRIHHEEIRPGYVGTAHGHAGPD